MESIVSDASDVTEERGGIEDVYDNKREKNEGGKETGKKEWERQEI